MPDDLVRRFRDHLVAEQLFPEAGRALVAVSGGADSIALLHLLHAVAPSFGLELVAAHVDHGIVPQSPEWARRVEAVAAGIDVPARCTTLALGAGATETRARRERYRALRRLQRDEDARYLVTAHHADDQVETVVFRVLRGSGPAGLAGIAHRGPRGLVRPLLTFRKAELLGWLRASVPGAPIVSDPANVDLSHDRSWVRATLLPLARERFGADLDERLLNLARQAGADRSAWSVVLPALPHLEFRRAPDGVEVARSPLQRYDKTLSLALLRALGREAGCRVGAARASRLLAFASTATSGRVMQLGGGWLAEITFDRLRLHRPPVVRSEATGQLPWGEAAHGAVEWGGWEISWTPGPAQRAVRADTTTWITRGPGFIRALQPGDRIRPHGGIGRRRVRRLMMEARIPRTERRLYPLIVRDSDILWIPGVCRSDVALPQPGEPSVRLDARRTRDP